MLADAYWILEACGTRKVITRDARFQAMVLMFRSPNVVSRSLLWISSKLGCRQLPVGAFEATVCRAIVLGFTDVGVASVGITLTLQLPPKAIASLCTKEY